MSEYSDEHGRTLYEIIEEWVNPVPTGLTERIQEIIDRAVQHSMTSDISASIRGLSPAQIVMTRLAQRDGWTCHYCGINLVPCGESDKYMVSDTTTGDEWDAIPHLKTGFAWPSADHVIPRNLGGTDADENLVLACPSCNTRKGTKSYEWAKANINKDLS